VSYSVRFEGAALVQLNGLPGAAFDALLARVTDLVDEPWDATVMPPGRDPAYRRCVFGAGYGLLTSMSMTRRRSSVFPTSPGSVVSAVWSTGLSATQGEQFCGAIEGTVISTV
jgi:hypothetical protein